MARVTDAEADGTTGFSPVSRGPIIALVLDRVPTFHQETCYDNLGMNQWIGSSSPLNTIGKRIRYARREGERVDTCYWYLTHNRAIMAHMLPSEYQRFAIHMAKNAGEMMQHHFSRGMRRLWTTNAEPVRETDLAINRRVIERVHETFLGHDILAEQESDLSYKSEYIWVCDPIDGTIPFSHGIPTCVFSLALTCNGESILGVVYDPFLDRMFFAEKGGGAFLNGQKISVSKETTLKNNVICSEHWRGWIYDLSNVAQVLDERGSILLKPCSITYMASLVATGDCLATIFPGAHPHDTAAVKVIIEEAGGKVTDLDGNEQRYDQPIKGHIASNGIIHDELLEIVRANMKEQTFQS